MWEGKIERERKIEEVSWSVRLREKMHVAKKERQNRRREE